LFEILNPIRYVSEFDKIYKYEIIELLGKCEFNNYKITDKLIKYVLKELLKCPENKLINFTKFLTNLYENDEEFKLSPCFNYVLIRLVKNITKLEDKKKVKEWLKLLLNLLNKNNKINFLQYSGYEKLNEISKKYENDALIQAKINLLNYKICRYFSVKTSSLHELCKYKNSIIPIKFIIFNNDDIDYNSINAFNKTPFEIALLKNNKEVIEFFISSGVQVDNQMKKLHKRLSRHYGSDFIFGNVLQRAFVKRHFNNEIINKVIMSYDFYDDINSIIKKYVDRVYEYIKNEDLINEKMKYYNMIDIK
jgi:hypothetical protein